MLTGRHRPPVSQEACHPGRGPTPLSLFPCVHRCSCPTGFEGPTCWVNTDDCVEHACANGGTCVDGVGNYTCQCPLQYAGTWDSSVCGEVSTGAHALSPIPVGRRAGAPPQCLQEVSPGPAGCQSMVGQLLSCLSLIFLPRKGL